MAEDTKSELEAVQAICRTEPRNPHVITVHEIWRIYGPFETTARPVIKMELCSGTLDDYLKSLRSSQQAIDLSDITEIMIHTLSGLAHCHDLHYCHRDIKLDNGTELPSVFCS